MRTLNVRPAVAIALCFAAAATVWGYGRGGGGAVAVRGGGGAVAAQRPSPAVGGFSGTARPPAASTLPSQGVTARGGQVQGRAGGGSYTTNRGTTVDYKGAGVSGTTPGGVNYGKAVGGVKVTTPGGQTVGKVGGAKGAVGPGGNAVGTKGGAWGASGPNGAAGGAYRGGVAIGPNGAVAGKSRVGVATGPGGTVVGGSRVGVAAGPHGVVAGGSRFVAGGGGHATTLPARGAIHNQGIYVRRSFVYYNNFTPAWFARYPGAWTAARITTASVWAAASLASVSAYSGGFASDPVYYDYGSSVTYEGDTVYINGDPAGTAEQYTEQAMQIADTGRDAKLAENDEWVPLGVFAMLPDGETTAYNIFQLALNKDGVIRGNYYNATTDSTEPIYGSVDKKAQRAAWTIGSKKAPVYEAGIANLTKDETTMMVHYNKDRSQQFNFIRIEQPETETPDQPK